MGKNYGENNGVRTAIFNNLYYCYYYYQLLLKMHDIQVKLGMKICMIW